MDVTQAKALAMFSLGVGSFILGMAPAFISQNARRRHPLLISCLLCFGGGVLLSTSLLHILPEARETLPKYSELMLCVGFFLVYVIDEIVHVFYGTSERRSGGRYGSGEHTSLIGGSGSGGELGRCYGDPQNPMMCHVSHTEPCTRSSSGMIGLLCALFVHSLLEGLAIGLQDTASQIFLLLAAVASHKYVVAFCLGTELCESTSGRICMHIVCVLLFSGGSVVGIWIGGALNNVNVIKNSVAIPIMQALAAGTLLYVTVSEVLPRERARWHEKRRGAGLAQFVAVVVGFGLMYLLTTYLDHDAL